MGITHGLIIRTIQYIYCTIQYIYCTIQYICCTSVGSLVTGELIMHQGLIIHYIHTIDIQVPRVVIVILLLMMLP